MSREVEFLAAVAGAVAAGVALCPVVILLAVEFTDGRWSRDFPTRRAGGVARFDPRPQTGHR